MVKCVAMDCFKLFLLISRKKIRLNKVLYCLFCFFGSLPSSCKPVNKFHISINGILKYICTHFFHKEKICITKEINFVGRYLYLLILVIL